jgi:hypothetical protein
MMEDTSSEEKRRYQRTLVEEVLRSAVIKPVNDKGEIWGMIINRSDHGVQVSIPIELAAGSKVEITTSLRDKDGTWDQQQHIGRICWCNPDTLLDEACNVGIEFVD